MAAVVNNVRTQGRCRRVSTSVYSSLTPRLGPSVRGQDPRHCNVNCTCKDGYCHVAGCSKISLHLQGRFLYIYIYTYIEALTVNYSPMQIIPAQATFASDWAPRQHGSDCIGHW